jgi:hypothetical protein
VFPDRGDIVFHGHFQEAGGALITVETPAGDVLGVLHHHVHHSPDGFQWGYGGSGPAETARCLLLAALEDPHCPHCGGGRKTTLIGDGSEDNPLVQVPFDPDRDDPNSELVFTCRECNDDGLIHVPHQKFKWDVVAKWPDGDWRMSRADILAWLTDNREATS